MQKISDRIYSVGVNDDDKELFEGLWPLPYGVSYNSYLVADEKIALIDTVESGFEDEFLDNINEAIGDRLKKYKGMEDDPWRGSGTLLRNRVSAPFRLKHVFLKIQK